MIHIALCLSDSSGSYYKHALVTAVSILENTRSRVCLHIVHDETFTEAAREAFARLCETYGQTLALYNAKAIPAATEQNVPGFLGRGALFKLMLPNLLSEAKVLYLDCDIVCVCDVADIYRHDLSEHYLGAVKMGRTQGLIHSRRLGMRADSCINTGVLLMNLEKIRDEIPDYADRLFEIVRTKEIRICDQGAINIFFDGNPRALYYLPGFCNLRTEQGDNSTLTLEAYQGNVIHYAGKKPWNVLTTPGMYYWKYYAKVFPDENVFERMEKLQPYEYAYLFSFLMRNESVRRWVNRLYEIGQKGLCGMLGERLRPRKRK